MAWHVTNQIEQNRIGPSGQPTPTVIVYFQLDNGTQGSVAIPKATYNVDTARERIEDYVAHLSAVADLTG